MGELCSDCYKREFVTDISIWGFGFYFGKNHCSKEEFIDNNYVTVKYTEEEAPEFIAMMKEIKIGDIVYLKSWGIGNNILHIHAIGRVTNEINTDNNRIRVNWLVKNIYEPVIPNKRYRQRVASIYKEYNKDIPQNIFDLIEKYENR